MRKRAYWLHHLSSRLRSWRRKRLRFSTLYSTGLRISHGPARMCLHCDRYFLNFTEFGLQINAGHEVMMDRCWLGETNFDYDHEKHGTTPNATAIQINGNDHYILNTIVFSAKIGLEVNGAADYITGVHVWFPVSRSIRIVVHTAVGRTPHAPMPRIQ